MTFNKGDRVRRGRFERTVEAVSPDGNYLWLMTDGKPEPVTYRADDWEVVDPFFEEGKNYRFGVRGDVITIWHVHDMAHGPVAVGQHTNGVPCMMTDFHGWHEA